MTKYHISPESGEPAVCHATVKACPVGGDHFSSEKDARAAFEENMADQCFNTLKKTRKDELSDQVRSWGEFMNPKRFAEIVDNLEKAERLRDSDPQRANALFQRAYYQAYRADAWKDDALRSPAGIAAKSKSYELFDQAGDEDGAYPSHPMTKAGTTKTLRDQLSVSDFSSAKVGFSEEYDNFMKKPTAANYEKMMEAVKEAHRYSTADHSNGGDHLVKAILNSSGAVNPKNKSYDPDNVIRGILAAEDWAAYDRKYPLPPKQESLPTSYGGALPEGFKETRGYYDVTGATFNVEGAKQSPNGSPQLVTHTPDGWYTATTAGYRLRGPFSKPEEAAECARDRSLATTALYYD